LADPPVGKPLVHASLEEIRADREELGPVVEGGPRFAAGGHAAAGAAALVEDEHLPARPLQGVRAEEPGDAGADDEGVYGGRGRSGHEGIR
jgi:hypothetical protein